MSLHIAPKLAMRMPLTPPRFTDEEPITVTTPKTQPAWLYTLAVVVRIGVLGTILFHALTLWSW